MSPKSARNALRTLTLLTAAAGFTRLLAAPGPAGSELAPVPRGTSRLQAVAALSGGGALPIPCLTPILQSSRQDAQRATAPTRRALALLGTDAQLSAERRVTGVEGDVVRFASDRSAPDRLDLTDDDGNSRPDAVDAVFEALARAQRLLTRQLELPSPGSVEVVMAHLGSGIDGYATTARDGRAHLWIDAAPRGGLPALRRAVEHQYAHAVGSAAGLDPSWGESLATWTTLTLDGTSDERAAAALARRLSSLGEGISTDDLELSAGNAAWLSFLDHAYGSTAVKLTVEELGHGGPHDVALDRALRRSGGDSLDAALREFQIWALLVGPRDDRRHFPFASQMPAPEFASVADALPALSIQADPEIAPLGAGAVLLRPGERTGGLTLRFEGDLAARWGADLLLIRNDGRMQRVPLALDAEGAGEVTVPVQELREAVLLVRNHDPEGRIARRYSWSAVYEAGYPAEILAVRAEPARSGSGRLVSWDTARETGAIGFNVLRADGDGSPSTRINPVWIPAIGESTSGAGYTFLDARAVPGASYRYRIEAITALGLTSRTDAVSSPAVE